MRKFGLCLFYGLCVFTIAFSLFWMALPRLPLPEAPADETPPISGSVIAKIESTEGYPPVVRLGTNGLKITKTDFRNKLKEMIDTKKIA